MAKNEVIMQWHGDECKVRAKNTAKRGVLSTALSIHAQTVMLVQVDEGNLRGSYMVKMKSDKGMQKIDSPFVGQKTDDSDLTEPNENNSAFVGSACVYAAAQEFGLASLNIPAYRFHPALRPAYDIVSGETLTLFKREGRDEFKEYFKDQLGAEEFLNS